MSKNTTRNGQIYALDASLLPLHTSQLSQESLDFLALYHNRSGLHRKSVKCSLAHRQGTNAHVRHNYISPFSSLRSSDLRFLSFGFRQLLFQLSNLFLQIGLGFLVAGLFGVKFLYLFLYGFLFLFGLRFGNGGLQTASRVSNS